VPALPAGVVPPGAPGPGLPPEEGGPDASFPAVPDEAVVEPPELVSPVAPGAPPVDGVPPLVELPVGSSADPPLLPGADWPPGTACVPPVPSAVPEEVLAEQALRPTSAKKPNDERDERKDDVL